MHLVDCLYAAESERVWRSEPFGAPKYTIRRLPKSLRALASQLDRINKSLYGPTKAFYDEVESLRRRTGDPDPEARHEAFALLKRRQELPDDLRSYAGYLESLKGRRANFVLDQEMDFLAGIESATGAPCLPEASLLLEAVYAVAKIKRNVSEKVLADRRDRYRKARKIPATVDYDLLLGPFPPESTERK
jgi:hypothetical protein